MKGIRKTLPLAALLVMWAPVFAYAGGQLYLLAEKPPVWADSSFPVPYNINPGSAAGYIEGVDPAGEFVAAVEAAFDTWGSIPTSRISFARGPDSADLLDANGNDGINLMVFHNAAVVQGIPIPLPPGVLGITNTVFDFDTGVLQGGAITLNTDPLVDNPNPDWTTSGLEGSIDVEAVVLHEAGHFQGMCHSAVRNDAAGDLVGRPSHAAVMFPFLANDVMDGRTPDQDDIAWQGFIYPSASYGTSFGAIQGDVPFGASLVPGCSAPKGVNGAHVVARDLADLVGGEPRMVVGGYSYTADGPVGRYRLPGLPPGEYGIWIEPMDGSPVSALQINTRIQFTTHTDFPEDWYSGAFESGVEANPNDPATASPVAVAAGEQVSLIDLIIENTVPVGCMNVMGSSRGGRRAWSSLAALAFFLVPFGFLFLLKRRSARGR